MLCDLDQSEEDKTKKIIQHWIRILKIKLGWIHDFNKLVAEYVIFIMYNLQSTNFFNFDVFRSSSKLLKTFTGHTGNIRSIDCITLDNCQFICSGSLDKTVRVWDVDANEQIQLFNGHSWWVYCVKFSSYHYHNYRQTVICSSSEDKTIRFWDIKNSQQFQLFKGHADGVCSIKFSPFNSGRYLCSGSFDKTICLWDVEAAKLLHVFNRHKNTVTCVDISPLQSNSDNNNENNSIGVIGGNGYTICSGSYDTTICMWDIETVKQFMVFKGHENWISDVKYGPNELGINYGANTILSGSDDNSVRLWDIRSSRQIQVFNGHKNIVTAVEYSPFIVNNVKVGGSSNVICSGSLDNTIRFWDIRSSKKELYVMKRYDKEDDGIKCIKFIQLKKNRKSNCDSGCNANLCYGSNSGQIHIWG
ncbi:WD-40 repeat protein [Reticulomyxa filosa]|uniref:WD-40 repeat protein n=1 Tax=Reticulomyxa filosa TaxID=46433 RepID=X6P7I3_RETFI|nr:WD-40 repeat protein [Reticulomyxa filosa]|eukprot:ETO34475.1 WD-40 repeat protein [Reticulomyxa filosa]